MRIRTKYLEWNAAITIVCGVLCWLIFKYLLPLYMIPSIWLVLCFFIVSQMGMNFLVLKIRRRPKQMPMSYMVIKALKFVLLVVIAVMYCSAVRVNIKSFLVTFAVLYIVWLCFDTTFFMKNQKKLLAEVTDESNKENKKNA